MQDSPREEGSSRSPECELLIGERREISPWSSFMWGYTDVGANIYVALGIVISATQGFAPVAFLAAGLIYLLMGFAYIELASAYPIAGGSTFYVLRGLGDFAGFIAGSALLLDYVVNIALFSVVTAGYLNYFYPEIYYYSMDLGFFRRVNLLWLLQSLFVILVATLFSVRNPRKTERFILKTGTFDLLLEIFIISWGFLVAWKPELLSRQWVNSPPTLQQFMYGSSLAIISYVGLEAISQTAQETRRPATIIPRTALSLILTVFLFALAFSTLAMGTISWTEFRGVGEAHPLATVAGHLPSIGSWAGPLTALMGMVVLWFAVTSALFGSARLLYTMGRFQFVSEKFSHIHPRFGTPVQTLLLIAGIAAVMTCMAFLAGPHPRYQTPRAVDILANLYAFGASLAYFTVWVAALRLRFSDPYTPRPYRVPLNLRYRRKDGVVLYIPLLGFLGALAILFVLMEVMLTHHIGRIAGPLWVLLSLALFVHSRLRRKLPVFRSLPRDWEQMQLSVLESAGEYDLLERYRLNLAERERYRRVVSGEG